MLQLFLTLSAGETLARFVSVLAFMLLARKFGETALGQIGLAITITSYALLAVQQGFNTPAVREVSRSPDKLRKYAEIILGLRLILAIFGFALIGGYAFWNGVEKPASLLLLVLGARLFGAAVLLQWPFQALEQPRMIAFSSVLAQIVFLGAVIAVPDATWILWVAAAQVAGELLASIYLWGALRRKIGPVLPSWDVNGWKSLVKDSWPMSMSLMLGNLLYNFDVFALAWLSGDAQIGLYLACYRCITVFIPFITMLSLSIFPALARLYPDRVKLKRQGMRIAFLTLPVCLVISSIMTFWAKPILGLLYGSSFQDGTRVLQVLAWALPIQGIRMILRQILLAAHLQKLEAFTMAMAVITNVIADLILVPYWGPLGCAVSTVLSELALWATAQYLLARHLTAESSAVYVS